MSSSAEFSSSKKALLKASASCGSPAGVPVPDLLAYVRDVRGATNRELRRIGTDHSCLEDQDQLDGIRGG
jgi:hypothetical protein